MGGALKPREGVGGFDLVVVEIVQASLHTSLRCDRKLQCFDVFDA